MRKLTRLGLVLAACLHLGVVCPQPSPLATLDCDLVTVSEDPANPGVGYVLVLEVQVDTSESYQAFQLDLSWQEAGLQLPAVFAHPEFNDQLSPEPFFTQVDDAQRRATIADLRHGGNTATGELRVARLFVVAPQGGPATLEISARLGRPDGSTLDAGAETFSYTP